MRPYLYLAIGVSKYVFRMKPTQDITGPSKPGPTFWQFLGPPTLWKVRDKKELEASIAKKRGISAWWEHPTQARSRNQGPWKAMKSRAEKVPILSVNLWVRQHVPTRMMVELIIIYIYIYIYMIYWYIACRVVQLIYNLGDLNTSSLSHRPH